MGQGYSGSIFRPSNAYGPVRSSEDESTPLNRKTGDGDPYWSGYMQQINSMTEIDYKQITIDNTKRQILNIKQQIIDLNKKLVDSEIYLEKLNEELSEMKKKEKGGGGKTKLLKRKNKTIKKKI